MQRFFIEPQHILADIVFFPRDISHQICRVLRLKAGQQITVLDNLGGEYLVELSEVENHRAAGRICSRKEAPAEAGINLFLYLCLSQREKFEWMLQKCTELGASGFIPIISSRSLVQEIEDKSGRRIGRWQSILREAAEQSGRGRLPMLMPVMLFPNAVDQAIRTHSRVLLPALDAPGRVNLRQALKDLLPGRETRIAVFIGPEGGFSADEVSQALAAGCTPVNLGPRVLRMETAAIAAAALIMHEFGEMG
jgi:16S rRNA (uracil1498-N3)-methyltransferase